MPIASFGKKVFSVSSKKVYTFDGFVRAGEINEEDVDVEGKKPSTYTKGPGLEQISFIIHLKVSAGVDVDAEIEDWFRIMNSLVAEVFCLGTKPIGQNKYRLKSIGTSNNVISNKGKHLSADLTLTFKEYVRAGKPDKTSAKSTTDIAESKKIVDSLVGDKSILKRENPSVIAAKAAGPKTTLGQLTGITATLPSSG